jgi:hypothetical protein
MPKREAHEFHCGIVISLAKGPSVICSRGGGEPVCSGTPFGSFRAIAAASRRPWGVFCSEDAFILSPAGPQFSCKCYSGLFGAMEWMVAFEDMARSLSLSLHRPSQLFQAGRGLGLVA